MKYLVLGLLLPLVYGCGATEHTPGAGLANAGSGSAAGADTGGAGGTAGTTMNTGGGDTLVTPVVQPCDNLGASGAWEQIGPPVTRESGKLSMSSAVDPNNFGTVYVGVGQAGFWKSTNCGADWTHIDTGKNAAAIDSGNQWQVLVDPVNSDVYTISGYGGDGIYRSSDGGVNFDDITPKGDGIPTFVQSFAMDPNNHKHLVVGFHDKCTGAYAPMCNAYSTDGGANWNFVVGPTSGWGEGAGMMALGDDKWLYGAPFDGLYYTGNSGASWEKVVDYPGCFYGLVQASGKYYLGCLGNAGIQQSTDGHTWTKLATAPQASTVVQAGNSLYSSFQNDDTGQPIWTASLDAPDAWTQVKTPTLSQGASPNNMSYDSKHHIMYLPAWSAGLWRVVLP